MKRIRAVIMLLRLPKEALYEIVEDMKNADEFYRAVRDYIPPPPPDDPVTIHAVMGPMRVREDFSFDPDGL